MARLLGAFVVSLSSLALLAVSVDLYWHLSTKTKSAQKKLKSPSSPQNEEIIREQLARNYAFLGESGVTKVRNAFVIVIGLGGVGSHAAHMLLRSGVGKLRLIDFDQVSLSSLNRHAVATQEDVGMSKSECLYQHFKSICPYTIIEPITNLFSKDGAHTLLSDSPDFVIDCIDNMETKLDLIEYCKSKNIRIISAMGAGAKSDPSRIQIADISETFEDPLARATRRGLRVRGIETGVTVVYSTEKPGKVKLLPLDDIKVEEAEEYAALPNFRVRILPVLGTIPALFGNALASYVVTELAEFKVTPLAVKSREPLYLKTHRDLVQREIHVFKSSPHLQVSIRDVGYILEEIWFGRSALSNSLSQLVLTRWNPTKPANFCNLVCLTKSEADKHDKIPFDQFSAVYSKEFLDYVERRLDEEKEYDKWRMVHPQFLP
ncbi:hypothetical protein HK098_005415 [Nowakowskiella sp. JEL0407]|nr:hypothetical protein HK098_005415 [Nowakowskiella sp. JEL0407]